MIRELRLENCIKHKDRVFVFNKGLTIIRGQNGNGKSLVQEMIRFALFGSQALRGKVSDYSPNMRVTLKCSINEDDIIIVRDLRDCSINGIVKGTTPCNEWIRNKLGYDLTVFDMGNAAKQGEIAKLGKMKPTERKLAIDQIIGLSAITKLIKKLKEEKSEIKSYISGFENSGALIEPKAPEVPEVRVDSLELRNKLESGRKLKLEYDVLSSQAKEKKCDEPIWVGDIPTGDLKNESLHKFMLDKFKELENLDELGSSYTEAELNEMLYESRSWTSWVSPEISLEEIESEEEKWVEYESWNKVEKVTCPKCGETFAINYTKKVEKPTRSKEYLKEQRTRHLTKPKCNKPEFIVDESFVENEKKKIAQKQEYNVCSSRLRELGDVDYNRLREYEKYKSDVEKYSQYNEIVSKLNTMTNIPTSEDLQKLESLMIENAVYEENIKRYEVDKKRYDDNVSAVDKKKLELEDIEISISGLNDFMTRVKNSVIPSLSKVSSDLVSEITNGKINKITVNDDFEISADGKEICLLSGGEEAGVNLALRLALSSILTRKVFNVFIGDEVDQSMDDERAESTANTLRKLNSQIEQMILITHKDVSGDYVIDI